MQKNLLFLFFILFQISAFAQDDYHNYLNNFLATDYSLPQGEYVFYDTEATINQVANSYGGNYSTQPVTDQEFSQKVRATISNAGNNPWDAGWKILNKETVATGDKMLAVFFLRSVNGEGEVDFFVENNTTFAKEVILTFSVTEEWRRYIIPFESMANYSLNSLGWGFHLARMSQTIEIGGFTAFNYKNTVAIDDLPSEINNEFYGGYEVDAPWRSEAADRIEQNRKADLTINVNDTNGNPIENAAVEVNMVRHNFDFGSAIVASRIADNPDYNIIYESKLKNLDGQGHGFNTIVFENDLKWDAWEEEWFVNKPELQDAVTWLKDNDFKIRGHTLVWPGTPYLPDDIPQNYGNVPYLQNRVNEHIEEIMLSPGIGTEVHDWDVLNEITLNENLANAFSADPDYDTGRELYVEIFEKARQTDAEVGLWLNDYVTMTLGNTEGNQLYDRLKQYTTELVNSNADIEGIGFQAHIGGAPNSIYDVLGTLDDFHETFGLKAKITEFDLPTLVSEELAANYLRDFMTAIYSHESTDGFLFWSFWDGQTYMNAGHNLYREDWSETPAHAAFVDLLFNEWWTEASLGTTAEGVADARVFKGLYEISYECDGNIVKDTVSITEAMNYEIICNNITTDVNEIEKEKVKIFPNPSQGSLNIERNSVDLANIRLFDSVGKNLMQLTSFDSYLTLDLKDLKGTYFIEVKTDSEVFIEKIIMQ